LCSNSSASKRCCSAAGVCTFVSFLNFVVASKAGNPGRRFLPLCRATTSA
jgi:hypothetical protein